MTNGRLLAALALGAAALLPPGLDVKFLPVEPVGYSIEHMDAAGTKTLGYAEAVERWLGRETLLRLIDPELPPVSLSIDASRLRPRLRLRPGELRELSLSYATSGPGVPWLAYLHEQGGYRALGLRPLFLLYPVAFVGLALLRSRATPGTPADDDDPPF